MGFSLKIFIYLAPGIARNFCRGPKTYIAFFSARLERKTRAVGGRLVTASELSNRISDNRKFTLVVVADPDSGLL